MHAPSRSGRCRRKRFADREVMQQRDKRKHTRDDGDQGPATVLTNILEACQTHARKKYRNWSIRCMRKALVPRWRE